MSLQNLLAWLNQDQKASLESVVVLGSTFDTNWRFNMPYDLPGLRRLVVFAECIRSPFWNRLAPLLADSKPLTRARRALVEAVWVLAGHPLPEVQVCVYERSFDPDESWAIPELFSALTKVLVKLLKED